MNKKLFKSLNYKVRLTLVLLAVSLVSVAFKSVQKKESIIDITKIVSSQKADLEISKDLVQAGERLFHPSSFMYADEIFAKALVYNPNNKKAEFYKNILSPIMFFKGIGRRMAPVLSQLSAADRKKYTRFMSLYSKAVRDDFLLEGSEDLFNEEDIQALLDQHIKVISDLRLYLKRSKRLKLKLNLVRLKLFSTPDLIDSDCNVVQREKDVYAVNLKCEESIQSNKKLGVADIEVLQHMTTGLQISAILSSSYKLKGSIKLSQKRAKSRLTKQQIFDHYRSFEEAGHLRGTSKILKIPSLGLAMIPGLKWLLKMRNRLCPVGLHFQMRPNYLFHQGICLSEPGNAESNSALNGLFSRLRLVLEGGVIPVEKRTERFEMQAAGHFDITVREFSTNLHLVNPLVNPIGDLKQLFPQEYTDCGGIKSFTDKTLGGVFPDGDANTFLKLDGKIDKTNVFGECVR